MFVPSLNEISGSVFEISCTQVKAYGGGGGGATEVKPKHIPDFHLGI